MFSALLPLIRSGLVCLIAAMVGGNFSFLALADECQAAQNEPAEESSDSSESPGEDSGEDFLAASPGMPRVALLRRNFDERLGPGAKNRRPLVSGSRCASLTLRNGWGGPLRC